MDISSLNTVLGAVTLTGVPLGDRINAARNAVDSATGAAQKPAGRAADRASFSDRGLEALANEAQHDGEHAESLAARIAAAAKGTTSGTQGSGEDSKGPTRESGGATPETDLNEQEREQLRELRARDREVRAHEQAHSAAAGSLASGGPSYETQRGPDGASYAVGGEVQISLREGSTPEESLRLAEQARRAALAPAQPSGQDRSVAAQAGQMAASARAEISSSRAENAEEVEPQRTEGSDEVGASKGLAGEEVPAEEVAAEAFAPVGNVGQPASDLSRIEPGARASTESNNSSDDGSTEPDRQAPEGSADRQLVAQRTRAYTQVARPENVANLLGELLG